MNILNLRKDSELHLTRKLKNLFSIELSTDIWRMELDYNSQLLGIELRDGEVMEVSFALIDLEQDRLLWNDLQFESGWWTGLSGLHIGYMLFYTYQDQQNPELKNAFAMDISGREVSWAYEGFNHLAFFEQASIGFCVQEEERSYARIDLPGGELESLTDEEGLEILAQANAQLQDAAKKNVFPVQYVSDSQYFSTVQDFLDEQFNIQAVKACEYLEIFDKIIISYYTANGEKLSNYILICDPEAELLFHEEIQHAGDGVALDTFFVSGRKLVFTKEKRIIECYEI